MPEICPICDTELLGGEYCPTCKRRVLDEFLKTEVVMLQDAVRGWKNDSLELKAKIRDLTQALRMVASGIWRDKSRNACGLTGDAVVVHAVEAALAGREGEQP